MGSDGDDNRRRKTRKHEGSGRSSRHRSDRESSDRRRRDESLRSRDSGRHNERTSRDRKKSRTDKDRRDDGHNSTSRDGDDKKLTEEEERLYAKAREYIEREGKESSRQQKKHGKESNQKRRRSESFDSNSSDSQSSRRGRRRHHHHHRSSERKDHKRSKSKREDGHGDKHRHKKKSNRDRLRDDDEKHRHKKKKHDSKQKDKPEKKSSTKKSFRDKESPVDSSKLVNLGGSKGEVPEVQLDPENDYFSHNAHLRLYLYRVFGIYFEDLTSSESHDAFSEFTKSYNEGKLERAYYDGALPQDALDQCSRTKHKWKFRTNRVEEQNLDIVRAGVKKQTEYSEKNGGGAEGTAAAHVSAGKVSYPITRMKNDHDNDKDDNSQRRKTPQEMAAQRRSNKHHRERIQLANEEMYGVGGKPDAGWERTREKKRQQSEKIHGAARDRDGEADGGAELDDDALYGGGTGVGGRGRRGGEVSYEEAVARERKYRERKEAEKAARTSELLKKEEEKQKNMLEMLGLSGIKAGQKITIAPRNDAA